MLPNQCTILVGTLDMSAQIQGTVRSDPEQVHENARSFQVRADMLATLSEGQIKPFLPADFL